MTMADRIAIMNAGKIEQLGTPTELYERPQTAFVGELPRASRTCFRGPSPARGACGSTMAPRCACPRGDLNGPQRQGGGRRPPGEDPARPRRGEPADRPAARDGLRRRRHPVRARDASRQRQRLRPEQRARRAQEQAPSGDLVEPGLHVRRRLHGGSRNDRSAHTAAAARARGARWRRDHAPGHPRRLRQLRHKGMQRHDQRRAEACEDPALLELDALHGHEQEEPHVPVARRVQEEVRRQRRLCRGHQRQRRRSTGRSRDSSRAASRPAGTSSSSPTTTATSRR